MGRQTPKDHLLLVPNCVANVGVVVQAPASFSEQLRESLGQPLDGIGVQIANRTFNRQALC